MFDVHDHDHRAAPGVPDYGIGRLINPRRRRQAAAAAPPATDGPGSGPLPSPDPDAWLQDVPSTSVEFYEQVGRGDIVPPHVSAQLGIAC